MSVTSGFFNSLNHDRRYNAQQMSSIFDGVINDGVFANIGVAFKVTAAGGVTVNVGEGKAWFNSAWVYNDTVLPLTFEASEVVLDRIDAIAIDVDHSESVRSGTIKIVKGTPSSSPKRPTMVSDKNHKQAPLVYIYRKAGSTEITQADITNMVGTSECPYITGILQVQNIDNIVAQWSAQWNQWYANKTAETNSDASELLAEMKSEFDIWFAYIQALLSERIIEADSDTSELLARMQSEFDIWFNDFKAVLDDDVATALAAKVADLQSRFDTLAKERAVYDVIEDSDLDVIIGSDGTPIRGKTVFGTGSSSSGGDGASLPLTGGEMLGPIRGLDTPIYDDQAVNKGYVDSGLADAKDCVDSGLADAKDYTDDQIQNRVILNGGKNLMRVTAQNTINRGVVYTNNGDGTITVDGTSTGESVGFIIGSVFLQPGTYIVSSLHGLSSPQLWVRSNGTTLVQAHNKDATLTLTEAKTVTFNVYQHNGYTYNNVVLKPMIRLASVEDSTFEPYYKGLSELTDNRVLLWENASPTSEFAPQTIALDLTQYRCVEVHVRQSTTSDVRACVQVEVGTATNGVYGRAFIMHDTRETRIIKVLSSGVTFAEGYGGAYNAATTILNGRAVPVKIYGVRW